MKSVEILKIYNIIISLEIPIWIRFRFQDSNSPLMEELIYLHDHIIIILVGIISLVGFTVASTGVNSFVNRNLLEGHLIEIIWTALPAVILRLIAFPSIRLLYLLDEVYFPDLSLKIIGHQWYWRYEYPDFLGVEFNSYILKETQFRCLDVDNRVTLPINSHIRLLIGADDVIHSWAIPTLAIKVDAVPGRINQVFTLISRVGLYFGQCSEICGAQHSFIPITIERVSPSSFLNWIKEIKNAR